MKWDGCGDQLLFSKEWKHVLELSCVVLWSDRWFGKIWRRRQKKKSAPTGYNFIFYFYFLGCLSFKGSISRNVNAGSTVNYWWSIGTCLTSVDSVACFSHCFCISLSLTRTFGTGLPTMAYWAAAMVLKVHTTTVPVFSIFSFIRITGCGKRRCCIVRDRLHWWRFCLLYFFYR